MPLTNAYLTVDELERHVLSQGNQPFSQEDRVNMEFAIQAVSEWLDIRFDTTFYAISETRYFTAQYPDLLYVDDLLTVTTLKTDDDNDGTFETTWASTDYDLEPLNAATGRLPRPYRQIRTDINGDYTFPVRVNRGVEIAGSWGYCTAANRPAVVKQFALLTAHRIWKRKDAIFGVAGAPALGVQVIQAQIQQDSDMMMLLQGIDRRGAYYG